MNITFISHMFPNALNPFSTPFMLERVKALSSFVGIKIKTVAPVSYFPFLKPNLPPFEEKFRGVHVLHPRYLALPSQLWSLRWIPYSMALKRNSHFFFYGS